MTTTSRSAKYAKWLSIPLGLAISALLIWQASYAAFSDTETVTANATAAKVDVRLGKTEMATFTADNLLPDEPRSHMVTAEYAGTVPADVSFHAERVPADNALAPHLNLQILATVAEDGDFGAPAITKYSVYNGPLTEFVGTHNPWKSTAEPGDSATLEFILTLTSSDSSLMGETVNVDFVATATNQ